MEISGSRMNAAIKCDTTHHDTQKGNFKREDQLRGLELRSIWWTSGENMVHIIWWTYDEHPAIIAIAISGRWLTNGQHISFLPTYWGAPPLGCGRAWEVEVPPRFCWGFRMMYCNHLEMFLELFGRFLNMSFYINQVTLAREYIYKYILYYIYIYRLYIYIHILYIHIITD